MPPSAVLNEFGFLLRRLCEKQGKSLLAVSRAAGIPGTGRIYNSMRATANRPRATILSIEELLKLAKILNLEGEAEQEFVMTAWLTNAPEYVRRYVRHLEREIGTRTTSSRRESPK